MGPNWKTGSPYYTTLVLAETISPTRSSVVDLNLENSTSVSGVPTVAYGIYDDAGKSRGKLVLINYDVQQTNQEQQFVIPSNLTGSISIRYLLSPSITETTNISWAGQTVRENGQLEGHQYSEVIACSQGCVVTLQGPGLALVLFDSSPDKFYKGNLSIVGVARNANFGIVIRVSLGIEHAWTMLILLLLSL
jgi:hypothetical protein